MRSSTILFSFLFTLAAGVACKDDAPAGAEFGEPCGDNPCADGLKCYIGYCEEKCVDDSDCQPVEGYRHECEAGGICHIYCEESSLSCPQTLDTPLKCGIGWCAGAS